MKDIDFYRNLGLKVIEPKWSLEESLLLWILLERNVLASDIFPSNVGRLQKEFNFLTNSIQEFSIHSLNKKSFGQMEGKIRNFLQYIDTYNREEQKDTDDDDSE